MFVNRPLRFLLVACAALALGSCSESSGPGGDGDTRLAIHLTDAPGDVTAAVVTISEVDLQGGPNGRVNLLAAPVTVDLVDLAQTTTAIVADADIEAATYGELRFVITGGYVEVDEGGGATSIYASSSTYAGLPAGAVVAGDLQMPSLGQSGLKVKFDDALVLDGEVDLLVDFDVAQSFGHAAGQSGNWVMHPVITGGRLEAAATVTASIRLAAGVTLPAVGGVTLTLADFKASLAGEALAFTDTDSDGTWTAVFRFVVPGQYQVALVAPAGLSVVTAPVGPVSVDLESGASDTVDFVVENAIILP
jgi:hypothetical protein